jgi:hypothetical protein
MACKMNLRRLENAHLPLWLLKDTCWMMQWKVAGMIMIVPTIAVAVWMIYHTRSTHDKWVNIATTCWILGNSFWMGVEFLNLENELKLFTLVPFIAGFISVIIFYSLEKTKNGRNHQSN